MAKISVLLSSSNNFSNTGMFSVDYAAYEFFSTNYPGCDLSFYVLNLPSKDLYPYDDIMPYEIYKEINWYNVNDIHTSDLIVFWSDFFHTRHYLEQYMEDYVLKHSANRNDIEDLFFKAFFLEGADESVLKKSISFGNSLMFLSDDNINPDRYSKNFNRLYSNIALSMPRDYVSLFNLISSVPGCNVKQGCDPAFTLAHRSFDKNKSIGIFIGRRNEIKIRDVFKIYVLSKILGYDIKWINWMVNRESFIKRGISNPSQMKNLLTHLIMSKLFKSGKGVHESQFTELGKYSLVITDTYHLSINAINSGANVFCIGDDNIIYNKNALDLHDKKKEVLFNMMDLASCYGNFSILKAIKASYCNFPAQYFYSAIGIENELKKICNKILGAKA